MGRDGLQELKSSYLDVEKELRRYDLESAIMSEDNDIVPVFHNGVFLVPDPRNPIKKILATKNLTPGRSYYGESLITRRYEGKSVEFRSWDPFRSKLSAAVLNHLKEFPFTEGTRCLYLGTSTGTTVSHISDIVGESGRIFAVEVAPRVAREFLENVVKYRRNIVPIIADAKFPQRYGTIYGKIGTVYADIAQPDQTQITIENCRTYFDRGKAGLLYLIVKASSIDALRSKGEVIEEQVLLLRNSGFDILERIDLEPFDKNHAMLVASMNMN